MTNLLRAVYACLLLLVIATAGCQQSSLDSGETLSGIDPQLIVERGGLRFIADSQVGLQLAAEKQVPCLLFFTAEWCTYCHQMEESAFVAPAIRKLSERFVCVLVDADREPAVCREFAVQGYPTVQFLAADGRKLHSLTGRQSSAQLASGMQAALERLAWLDNNTPSHF